jgi:multiple antibiotic resistance protein
LDWTLAAKLFAALFAIMNPLGVIPAYLALTADHSPEERRGAALMMTVTVVAGALVCALAGQAVLSVFGIDVPHFRLAGGVIVLMIALSMLKG